MNITILGTGHMARTLGAGLVSGGHAVTFGSRTPDTSTGLPGDVYSHAEAIGRSGVIVNALAAAHSLDTLTPLAQDLAGRTLIDIGNAVDDRMDLIHPDTSLGERLQNALPGTSVVKSLNTVGGPIGADPGRLAAPTAVFLSGDDAAAKRVVSALLTDLGWSAEQQIDLGGISTARAVEHYFLLFAATMSALRSPDFNIAIIR